MTAVTAGANGHLSQHQQYKMRRSLQEPGGEDSATPILEIHLQAVQGYSRIHYFLLNLYVHLEGVCPSRGSALHTTSHTNRSSVSHGHELFHHLQARLMQCIPVTAKEALSKLEIRLAQMRPSCLSHSAAGQQLVEQ